jgi:hypothetical protein
MAVPICPQSLVKLLPVLAWTPNMLWTWCKTSKFTEELVTHPDAMYAPHRWQPDEYGGAYMPTELGKAAASAGLDPKQALDVKDDLERARQGFCMATDLHLTFLVTPVQEEVPVNWQL